MTKRPAIQPSDAEREAFEAWARSHLGQGYPLDRDEGAYINPVTRWAFTAWKAGRAAIAVQPPAASEPNDTVKRWCETCEGDGYVFQEPQAGCHVSSDHPCPDCDGKGYWVPAQPPAASQPSEPCFNRARVMADEVMTELQATESAWDDDDIDRIQSSLLPRVYDCLNLLAAAQAPKEPT